MRSYYIQHEIPDNHHGCKGGIAGDDEFEVEIGSSCNFSFEMIALCTLHDEIIEFLTSSDNPLAKIIIDLYQSEIKSMDDDSRPNGTFGAPNKESTSA
jgi:hypothetical protein